MSSITPSVKKDKKRPSVICLKFHEAPSLKEKTLDDKVTVVLECTVSALHDDDDWSAGGISLEVKKCKVMNEGNAASMSMDKLKDKISKKD